MDLPPGGSNPGRAHLPAPGGAGLPGGCGGLPRRDDQLDAVPASRLHAPGDRTRHGLPPGDAAGPAQLRRRLHHAHPAAVHPQQPRLHDREHEGRGEHGRGGAEDVRGLPRRAVLLALGVPARPARPLLAHPAGGAVLLLPDLGDPPDPAGELDDHRPGQRRRVLRHAHQSVRAVCHHHVCVVQHHHPDATLPAGLRGVVAGHGRDPRLDGGLHDAPHRPPDRPARASPSPAGVPHEHPLLHRGVCSDPVAVRGDRARPAGAECVPQPQRLQARPGGRPLHAAVDPAALHDLHHLPVLRPRLLAPGHRVELHADLGAGHRVAGRLHPVHVRLDALGAVGEPRRHHLRGPVRDAGHGVRRGRLRRLLRTEGVVLRRVELDQLVHPRHPLLLQRVAAAAVRLEELPAATRGRQEGRVAAACLRRAADVAERRVRHLLQRDEERPRHALWPLLPQPVSAQVALR